MKDCGELTQFISIRIVRNRLKRKTWLNQAAYIEKIAARFNLLNSKPIKIPLPTTQRLNPILSGLINPKIVKLYQQEYRSTLFPAV
jgi:hypothetical protein